MQYLIKWDGYGHEDNTWEPENNIESKVLIENFNREYDAKNNNGEGHKARDGAKDGSKARDGAKDGAKAKDGVKAKGDHKSSEDEKSGFERGLKVEKIIGEQRTLSCLGHS